MAAAVEPGMDVEHGRMVLNQRLPSPATHRCERKPYVTEERCQPMHGRGLCLYAYLNKNIMRCLFLNHRDDGDDDDGDDDDALCLRPTVRLCAKSRPIELFVSRISIC